MSATQKPLPFTKTPRWCRIVARLLWLANSDPPDSCKHGFYQMKERILERYGKRDGHDWQEITQFCWSCEGTGGLYEPGGCYKCGGSGVHRRFWVLLERWEMSGCVFHRPAGRTDSKPNEPVAIKGYVRHGVRGAKCTEAACWLALIFERRLLRCIGYCCWSRHYSWRTPLYTFCSLRGAICDARRLAIRFVRRPFRTCEVCGARLWFRGVRFGWDCCSDECERYVPF